MPKFKNGWNVKRKQGDRYLLEMRFGKVTLFKVLVDVSDKHFEVVLFNYGIVF